MNLADVKKVVCIFAHPDDESFGPGATIAKLARTAQVELICVTDGDGIDRKTGRHQTTLGRKRKKELLSGSEVLGVSRVHFLGFHDGSLSNNLYHEAAEKILSVLDRFKPDTLLTFSQNGVSGHLDHIAVAMITTYLYEKLPYVKRVMYYTEDYRVKDAVGEYFVFFPRGIAEDEADLVVDVSAELPTKIAAMKKHVTQKSDWQMILRSMGEFLSRDYFMVSERPPQ